MKTNKIFALALISASTVFASCQKNDPAPQNAAEVSTASAEVVGSNKVTNIKAVRNSDGSVDVSYQLNTASQSSVIVELKSVSDPSNQYSSTKGRTRTAEGTYTENFGRSIRPGRPANNPPRGLRYEIKVYFNSNTPANQEGNTVIFNG